MEQRNEDSSAAETWLDVQASVADVPGEAGIRLRAERYRPYFLRFGRDVVIEEGCRFYRPEHIELHDDVRINVHALIYGSGGVRIGRHARIGPRFFLHSANHDITQPDRAFHETGYQHHRTTIGDNCLVSANVSVMPGARIGANTFIACGAVVTKGDYPDGARLFGVPARQREGGEQAKSFEAAPNIVLISPDEGWHHEAAKLLVTSLGLPQVAVIREGEAPSRPVKARFFFGPADWQPSGATEDDWRFVQPDRVVDDVTGFRLQPGDGESIAMPAGRGITVALASDGDGADNPMQPTLKVTCYNALKRLAKQESTAAPAVAFERRLLGAVAATFQTNADDPLWQGIIKGVGANAGDARALIDTLRADAQLAATATELNGTAGEAGAASIDQIVRDATVRPHWLVAVTLGEAVNGRALKMALATIVTKATKAAVIAAAGLCAELIGVEKLRRRAEERLFSSEFFNEATSAIHSDTNRRGFCYSPLLAALLLVAGREDLAGRLPALQRRRSESVAWRVLPEGEGGCCVESSAGGEGFLFNCNSRQVSVSLLDHWLCWLSAPRIQDGQFELRRENYAPAIHALERVWLELFRDIAAQAGEPLLRLKPWPAPYRAALSLRYDVDRPIGRPHVQNIVAIQRELLNGACGSWYFFHDAPPTKAVPIHLERNVQEVGRHTWKPEEAAAGQGATAHSAPGSMYWRGAANVDAAEHAGAAYAEMLAAQLGWPRPAWLADRERASRVWLTPIHFPLEGSTNDTTLAYFDLLRDRCLGLIESGGHVIIASHPDLNQEILSELIQREDFSDCWVATVGDAVSRVRAVMEYGRIRVVVDETGRRCLVSQTTLADVAGEVWKPDGGVAAFYTQLNANEPRAVFDELGVTHAD